MFPLYPLSAQSFLSRFDLIPYVPTDAITGYHRKLSRFVIADKSLFTRKLNVDDGNINSPEDFVDTPNYIMENFPSKEKRRK